MAIRSLDRLLFALAVLMVTGWVTFIIFWARLGFHDLLEEHTKTQREFNTIQSRYICLQDFPEQTPEDLKHCDDLARKQHPAN